MPPPMTTTSKCRPAIASIAAVRVSMACLRVAAKSSVEEGDGCGRGSLRHGSLLARLAEVEQADEALALRQADRGPSRLLAQQAGAAPVAGEAAGMGGEQDDVGGDGGRVQVLLA